MDRLKLSKLSEFLSSSGSEWLSGRHSRTPDSHTCWVDSEAQWDSSGWQVVDGRGEEQHQRLGWGDQRGSRVPVRADTEEKTWETCRFLAASRL